MARPPLTERRKAQTRLEIAESALGLFLRHGYDNVGVDAVAEDAGVSLRTFYRYFGGKHDVLSPIITDGTHELIAHIAARPPGESLAIAVERAYGEVQPQTGEGTRALIALLTSNPILRARWLHDLREIEDALLPVIQQRARHPLTDEQAQLAAATIVTALRTVLELSTRPDAGAPSSDALARALLFIRNGATL